MHSFEGTWPLDTHATTREIAERNAVTCTGQIGQRCIETMYETHRESDVYRFIVTW